MESQEIVKADYTVLVDWEVTDETSPYVGTHPAGSIVSVDSETADPLVADGTLVLKEITDIEDPEATQPSEEGDGSQVPAPENTDPSGEDTETLGDLPQEETGNNQISNPGND